MKKKEKKLILSKETLKRIQESDIQGAAGGFETTEEWSSCDCDGKR
jgi:hypothetical protein